MKKLLEWMWGVSIDIRDRIHYDNRIYLLVFWANVLGVFHLLLEPLAYVNSLYRKICYKIKKSQVDDSTDDIPF